jgi:SAM-dependent methyltransferase
VKLNDVQISWDHFGKTDPLWSILSIPGKRVEPWQPHEFFATGETAIAGLMERLRLLGIPLKRRRALDFGCGVGRLTQALARYFDRCYGVDIAPSMIELAKRYNCHGDRCRYFLNARPDLSQFESGQFDLICTFLVLQHLEPDYAKSYLREFLRLLTPGGLLVFQLPAAGDAEDRPRKTLPTTAHRAQFSVDQGQMRGLAGSRVVVGVKVKNLSEVTWPGGSHAGNGPAICLGNRWRDLGGLLLHDGLREVLPSAIGPGEDVELRLVLQLPMRPGDYLLELDLVEESVTWFQDRGYTTPAHVSVHVQESSHLRPWFARTLRGLLRGFRRRGAGQNLFLPKMEMYLTRPEEVTQWVRESGGAVLDRQAEEIPGYISHMYWVHKV